MTVTDLRSAPQSFRLRHNGCQLEKSEVPKDVDLQDEEQAMLQLYQNMSDSLLQCMRVHLWIGVGMPCSTFISILPCMNVSAQRMEWWLCSRQDAIQADMHWLSCTGEGKGVSPGRCPAKEGHRRHSHAHL